MALKNSMSKSVGSSLMSGKDKYCIYYKPIIKLIICIIKQSRFYSLWLFISSYHNSIIFKTGLLHNKESLQAKNPYRSFQQSHFQFIYYKANIYSIQIYVCKLSWTFLIKKGIIIIIMESKDGFSSSSSSPNHKQPRGTSSIKNIKNIDEFKQQFFNFIRTQSQPAMIQKYLLTTRSILKDKVILHMYTEQPKLYNQFRYLILALGLSFEKKEEFNQRWFTFYEIINEILKIPNDVRKSTKIEEHVINFTYFLLDQNYIFFDQFPQTKNLMQSPQFQASSSKNQQQTILAIKKIVRIFNSLLCLKFIGIDDLLLLVYHFGLKSQNYTQFLISIEEKLVKRILEFQKMQQPLGFDSQFVQTAESLEVSKIYVLLHLFYDLDPQNKLRELLKKQLGENHQKAFILGKQVISYPKIETKSFKNKKANYEKLLKFIIKQILKNKLISIGTKKQFIIECFSQVRDIDEEFFESLLEAQSNEENQQISQIIIKCIERESLNFISVSRLRSILKRINLSKHLSYSKNMNKIFRILKLVDWIARKFNQPHPTYQLQLNSSLKIQNIRKATMLIFSIDLCKPHVGRIIQFQVNKNSYDIVMKYSQTEDSCFIEIIVQMEGIQKIKQKKEIKKWSYILCLIRLQGKKQISIMIDGALLKPLPCSGSEITTVQFGPFYGSIKDVYILEKPHELCQMHKRYSQSFRKMDLLLEELGQKNFIFTFDRGKTTSQKSIWIWRKEMMIDYQNVKKLRAISFGEGVEQLGGFPALLFLATRIMSQEGRDDIVNFLIDFFQFFKLMLNESSAKQAQKWMLVSTQYFGQFLWLILSKNQYLRDQKKLFNRIFDFFDWFHKLSSSSVNGQALKLAIIEDIYLNFEIWSKCSRQIKLMLFAELQKRLQDTNILLKLRNNQGYQRIMCSIVFFFLQENLQESTQMQYYLGVPLYFVHMRISSIGSKFCQFYSNEKIQYNPQIIQQDINTIMSLINTFFYKKHLYFSKGEVSALSVLLDHYDKNFRSLSFQQKIQEYHTYIINQLAYLISICPYQSQAIFMLFQLALGLITEVESLKGGTAIIVDALTLRGQRIADSLEFAFKATLFIIKNSKNIYEPNSVFDEEQIISVMLGSLRIKVYQRKQLLKYANFAQQFTNFPLPKLKKLFSLTQFCMIVEQCVDKRDRFPIAVFILKLIINKGSLLPEGSKLGINCIKIINNHLKSLQLREKEAMGQKIEPTTIQIAVQKQGIKVGLKSQSPQQLIKQQVGQGKVQEMIEKKEEKEEQKGMGLQQQKEKEQKVSEARMQEVQEKQNKEVVQKQKNETLVILQQILEYNDLQHLFKYCKCPELVQMLIKFNSFSLSTFQLPLDKNAWESGIKNYGGDLSVIFKIASFNINQLSLLSEYVQKENINQRSQEQGMSNSSSEKYFLKDPLRASLPFLILSHALIRMSSELEKDEVNEIKTICKTIFKHLGLKQLIRLFNAFKNSKNGLTGLNKIEENNVQRRKIELYNISKKIAEDFQSNNNQDAYLETQLTSFKEKFQKENYQPKYVIDNAKILKSFFQKIKQVLTTFQLLIQVFAKTNNEVSQKGTIQPFLRKKTDSTGKKKRSLELPDMKQKEKYELQLRNLIRQLSLKMQSQSKKKEEMWKNLAEKNRFWTSSKIKNNECYQIHPKITGFYRLNIIKTAFQEVPYPRRKSFEHELQQQNPIEPQQIETKNSGNYIIKSLFVSELSTVPEANKSKIQQNISKPPKKQVELPKQYFIAEYITQRGVYAGTLHYEEADNYFIFKSRGYDSLPKNSIVYQNSTIFHRIDDKSFRLRISLNLRSQVFARRYIHRHTAIEIFSFHQSFFFNFFFKDIREKFFKLYSNKMKCISDVRAEFERREYTQKWRNGKLDNFQYLMLINIFSGRTYNDLAQYPVMPWVLTNFQFKETQLNKEFLKDQKNIRDLSKPPGKLNPKKFQNMKMRCCQIDPEDVESKFLYGTMYSNPTVIYNFFIRLQPFTTLHWQHQGRRIDHADRLFSTVAGQFNTVITSTSDNKELIPQFYYWPQFLKNRNKVNLGTKQNKEEVDDVKLPGWSKNPQQFIFKMREVFESAEVSKNIHQWIDLVFGFKNPKEVALQYDNLYHYRTYEHDIFETEQGEQAIRGAQITISQFGQIPFPLFLKPHPQKLLLYTQHVKLDTSIIIKKSGNKKIVSIEANEEGFFVVYENQVEYYPIENNKPLDSSFEKPAKSFPSIGTCTRSYDFFNSIWLTLKQGVFRIYNKKMCAFQFDTEMQCFSFYGRYVIYGYRSQLVVARIGDNLKLTRINSFYGHKNNICNIEVDIMLDIVLSIDEDGLVLIHEFEKQKLLREFDLGTKSSVANICIHQMGYFIFLTKDQKLIIYTFLGELFLNQDIGISIKAISENITKVKIFEQNRSLLLMSTDKGKIYMVDFLQIKRFNQNCTYKQFSRFKINILENCPRLGSIIPIKNFFIKAVPGDGVLTYKLYVHYQNNSIIYYYSAEQLQQKLKKNKIFNPLGFFDSEKAKDTDKSNPKEKLEENQTKQ